MNKLYAAPMEGLTGYLWRQVHAALFGPADKYFTPFLSPNATRTFQRKELDEIDPAHNAGLYVVPQLLTNRAEHFLWAAGELYARGLSGDQLQPGLPGGHRGRQAQGLGPAGLSPGAGPLPRGDLRRTAPGDVRVRQDPHREK